MAVRIRWWLVWMLLVPVLVVAAPASAVPAGDPPPEPQIQTPVDITTGPDGNVWFVSPWNGSIGRMSVSGELDFIVHPDIVAPWGIAAGPDGNMWFADSGANAVGKVAPATDSVTVFTGVGIDTPTRITAGADGNLWFTNLTSIGRITPAGVVSSFTTPGIGSVSGITAGADGNLWVAATSGVWRATTSGVLTLINARGVPFEASITASADGNLWFIDGPVVGRVTPSGVLTTFSVPESSLLPGITSGPDGNVWFTNPLTQTVGRITATGKFSEFRGTGIGQAFAITTGPDGNLWIANESSIGRLSPGGLITHRDVGGTMQGIAAGPDGNLWLTNPGYGSIVRIDPNTSSSQGFSNGSLERPWGITAGPDGNMWFTDRAANTIGRITTDGAITLFSDPGVSTPTSIAAGPDGNLWFTSLLNASIGRITPTGTITMFSGPGINSQPNDITAGPDGALWFTDQAGIGRISPTGQVTHFAGGGGVIAVGPDGNIWFARGGSIGRMTLDGAVTRFPLPAPFPPSGAYDIQDLVAGPDGNVWFTIAGDWWMSINGTRDSVGAMSVDGDAVMVTDAPRPLTPNDDFAKTILPQGIAVGADGNIWFVNGGYWVQTDTGFRPVVSGTSVSRVTPGLAAQRFDGTPGRPGGVTATAGNHQATVAWNPPATDGGSTITEYLVTATPGGATCSWTSGPLGCTVTGLTNGTLYAFTVSAINSRGPGQPSAPSPPVTPAGPPTAPDAPTIQAAVPGSSSVTVTWAAPVSDGGSAITSYTAAAYINGTATGQTCTWSTGPLSCIVTGLTPGTSYTFRVSATNSVGTGPPSSPSSPVTALGMPNRPAKPTAAPGNTTATVTWTVPGDNGAAIDSYTVTAYRNGAATAAGCSVTPPATTCEVTGLENGSTYTFTVHATNALGPSPESDPSDPITPAPPSGHLFHPSSAPTRILDSRPAPEQIGPYGTPWGPGVTRPVTVAGVGGVPSTATAVVLNVTVTGTTAPGFLTLWPSGEPRPTASNLNWSAGQTLPNAVTVKVGAGGQINVFNNAGSTSVIIDVVGYYDQSGTGAGFTAQPPTRVLDSRPPPEQVGPYGVPWVMGADREVVVAGVAGVPADAEAVVLNVTATSTTSESFLSVYPNGAARPTASNLNWTAGVTIPNAVTVKVGAGGKIRVFNNSGSAHVIIDVVGYFKTGSGDAFHPVSPVRFQDSRPAPETVGAHSTPWSPNTSRAVSVTTGGAVPTGAKAVLANVTVTSASAESFLTVWNTGATKPTASNLNWRAGTTIANAVTAKIGTGDTISVFNNSGTVNVIADVAGWYG